MSSIEVTLSVLCNGLRLPIQVCSSNRDKPRLQSVSYRRPRDWMFERLMFYSYKSKVVIRNQKKDIEKKKLKKLKITK